MRATFSEFAVYVRLIARKWALWAFLILDLAAVAVQLIYPPLRVPQGLFIALAAIGLVWAAFQVHSDITRELPSRARLLPLDYELLPLSFEVRLDTQIPDITIWFYAINHHGREMELQSLDVVSFNPSGGPTLHDIPIASRPRIPRHASHQVHCQRSLIESEVRAIRATQHRNPSNATISAASLALSGRRAIHCEIQSGSLNGWIHGAETSNPSGA